MRNQQGAALPALVVASPFAAYSFQLDERRTAFRDPSRFGTDPFPAAEQAWDEIGSFIERGNFRPVGRFLEYQQKAFMFDVAEATTLPLDVVQGLFRLLMIGVLVVIASRLVGALARSAGCDDRCALTWWVPLVMAGTLVAGGRQSAIVAYPFALIGSAALCLWVPQLVARDRDMARRSVGPFEIVGLAAIGALLTMIYDLAYIAPVLSIAFVAARGVASGLSLRVSSRTAAAVRVLALTVGFLTVFVPLRLHLRSVCAGGECYDASDAALSAAVPGLVVDRVMTGAPVFGWHYMFSNSPPAVEVSLSDLLRNGFVLLVLGAVAILCARAARDSLDASGTVATRRLAISLMTFAVPLVVCASLVVALSRWLQGQEFAIGRGWRETPLVQMGWGLLILGVIAVVLESAQSRRSRVATVAVAVGCALMLSATFLANARLAQFDRRDEAAALLSEIATTTSYADTSAPGNRRRCELIGQYTELHPDPKSFVGGDGLRSDLDRLMMDRHGYPYCDEARP